MNSRLPEQVEVTSPPRSRRYDEIDILRGFAALWVVLSHYLPYWNRYIGPAPIIVPNFWGVHAVKLFFIISGFVIFMTLERCRTVLDFAVLRFSRLYPAYWAALLVATSVSVLVFGDHFWLGGFVVNATMFQDFLGYSRYDNVTWTLTVEMTFYLLAGCLFALRLHRYPLAVVATWIFAASIWALAMYQPSTANLAFDNAPTWPDPKHSGYLIAHFALDYAPYFGLGILFFDVARHGWSKARVCVMMAAVGTEFLIAGWPGLCVATVSTVLFALAINGNLKLLVGKVTLWLGAISYSLYLIHRNLGFKSLSWAHEQGMGPAVAVPLVILAALLLASMLTYGVERPAMRRIRSRYKAWKAAERH